MALDTYANFQAAIADHLVRTDLTSQIVDCITLFEAEAANELAHGRQTQNFALLHPLVSDPVVITGAADNGSGLIRLTLTSSSGFTTGDTVNITEVSGTTEANGEWVSNLIDSTTIDLQDSTFVNTYISGGTAQPSQGWAALPSDYLAWERVTYTGNPRSDMMFTASPLFAGTNLGFTSVSQPPQPHIFTIENRFLYVFPGDPTPLEMIYFAKNDAISASLNWLFTNRVDCYWNGVLEQIYRYTKDYDQASVYQQAKGAIFDQIKKQRIREDGQLVIKVAGSNYGQTP